MLGEHDVAIRLKLLKRLLEKGSIISREEAAEYWDYLKPLLIKGALVEDKEGFKGLPEGFLLILQQLVESGVCLETILKEVDWRSFERITAGVFRLQGFKVREHFRFRVGGALREVDLLVETPMFFISIDCKQWIKRNYSLRSACRLQFERSALLFKYLFDKGIKKEVYPLVITFLDSESGILENCLVIPIWKVGEVAAAPEVLKTLVNPVPLL